MVAWATSTRWRASILRASKASSALRFNVMPMPRIVNATQKPDRSLHAVNAFGAMAISPS
jgi:hypothetical protein